VSTILGLVVESSLPVFSATPAGRSNNPTKAVTLFYPGRGGYQWLRSSDRRQAYKKVIQGDSYVSCHENEEADTGEPQEIFTPTPAGAIARALPARAPRGAALHFNAGRPGSYGINSIT